MNKENGIKRLNRLSVKAKEYRDKNTQVVKLSQAIEVVELLDEPKPLTEDQAWKVIADVYNQDADLWKDAKNHYLNSLKEPQVPVVPQFVADFIEYEKIGRVLFSVVYELNRTDGKFANTPVKKWIFQNTELQEMYYRQETFIKAWLHGYEIEKKQRFLMPVPYLSDGGAYFVRRDEGTMAMVGKEHLSSGVYYYKFTQTELDERFPDIKHMAEEVSE